VDWECFQGLNAVAYLYWDEDTIIMDTFSEVRD
jgi:hypothetical protein